MPLLGSAAMLLSFDIAPEAVDEHDRWHSHEHLPERLAIPGFLRGTRWTAIASGPRYMVIYEVQDLQTLASEAYLARLNDPSPWTQRMMPSYRGMSRGLCTVLGSTGQGQGGTAALIRFGSDDADGERLQRWLLDELLPAVPGTAGLVGAHLLRGAQAAAMTNEQRIRGADRSVDSALVVTGYDAAAVAAFAAGLAAADGLPARGASELRSAVYAQAHSLTRTEASA